MGDQSRLIQCGQLLLEKGHQIDGIISKAPPIQSWAKENNLRLIAPVGNVVEKLKRKPFDLFFSIDNFNKVTKEILALPRVYAINFHDAPLPRYGGVNATNWAIMNGETKHGITWHVMTDVMDAGDILKQKTFSVSATETAYSLNAKCYEESIKCFSKLMDELANGKVKCIRQNLECRTYFPRWKRPPAACSIDWNRSADEIYALIRGLDFKSFWNPLGLPKLYLDDNAIIITQLNKLESWSPATPGTITAVSDNTITVATATNEVLLAGFSLFSGESISPSKLLVKFGLREGSQLPKLETERAEKITNIHRNFCRFEGYWLQRLAGLEPIEIPYKKRADSASDKIKYQEARFLISMPNLDYQEFSEKPGDILLSAFLLYLSRISMKENFDINFRDSILQEELKGEEVFFASHVPLRIDVDYELSFKEFSETIQNQIKSSSSYGSYARDLILREPNLVKNFMPHFSHGLPVAVERIKDLSEFQPTCKGEFIFVIPDNGKECLCFFEKEVLSKASIDRLREQFTVLLHDIALKQDRPIGDLCIIPEQERQILLSEWHGPDKEFPQQTNLGNLFESQVELTPDADALVFNGQRISYRQLNRLANKVAYKLQSLGIEPDSLVALCVERSIEMVVGIIGIIKSGGAYVPLDPAYPKDRLAFILEDTRASILLTQQHLKANLPESSAKIITFDTFEMETPSKDLTVDKNPLNGVKSENLAYVIYTSGSTGKPKGVLVTHGNVIRLMKATERWYNFVSDDIWTLFHSFAFDFSVWEMWGALLYGGRLVIIPYEVSRSPSDFYQLLIDEQVTVLNQTPSAFYQLIQAEETQQSQDDLALRLVIFGGEVLELQNLKPWFKRHGDKKPQLVNMYGITETTVHVTYRPITKEDAQGGQGSVIGEPIPDLQLYVLDRNLQPVPIGVAGELFVGGAGLARGYLNRLELTKERFISNPFNKKPGARLYKTGDVARFLPNRDLEYLGRADHQVQIRGFRVELGEIETVLLEHENVNQAVVIVRGDQADDQRLAAYFVSTPNQSALSVELRKHLQSKLPEYMIPHYFVELESIPLTHNGKVDRRTLPEPQFDRQTEETYVAPRNEVEKLIADIWQQLLNIKNIGIQDNFFEIGGHSLLLVRLLYKLQRSFKKEFSIVEMFRHPTIATLADFVTQKQEAQTSFATTFDLVNKQKQSLKRQRRLAKARK
jgi:amino acid adenylation domain-containing protein